MRPPDEIQPTELGITRLLRDPRRAVAAAVGAAGGRAGARALHRVARGAAALQPARARAARHAGADRHQADLDARARGHRSLRLVPPRRRRRGRAARRPAALRRASADPARAAPVRLHRVPRRPGPRHLRARRARPGRALGRAAACRAATSEAGCGTCHSGLKIGPAKLVDKGRALVAEVKCASCHAAGSGAPDLSTIGLHGFRADWHAKHVERSATAQSGVWQKGFSPLADEEVAAVSEYLHTAGRRAAADAGQGVRLPPRLPRLSPHRRRRRRRRPRSVGRRRARASPSSTSARVAGAHTLPSWLKEHFLNPVRVVPGSQMPQLGFTADEADLLTLFMLSLAHAPGAREPGAARSRARAAARRARLRHRRRVAVRRVLRRLPRPARRRTQVPDAGVDLPGHRRARVPRHRRRRVPAQDADERAPGPAHAGVGHQGRRAATRGDRRGHRLPALAAAGRRRRPRR